MTNYLQSHTLNVKLINPNELKEARSLLFDGDGRKMKDKKGLESMMAAALMMKGNVIYYINII